MSGKNIKVDLITISESLMSLGLLHAIGGNEALLELQQSVTSAAHISHHARIVAETSVLRRLIDGATEILSDAYETRPDGESVSALLDRSESRIFQLATRAQNQGPEPVEPVDALFQRLCAALPHTQLVVTLGAAGLLWRAPGLPVVHRPAHAVEVVNTNGAGDTLHGALLLALAEGLPPSEALHFGAAAAACSVTGRPYTRAQAMSLLA